MKGVYNNMTRKHYKAIAKLVKDNTPKHTFIYNIFYPSRINRKVFIDSLCTMFKKDNSLFDKNRFIDACK